MPESTQWYCNLQNFIKIEDELNAMAYQTIGYNAFTEMYKVDKVYLYAIYLVPLGCGLYSYILGRKLLLVSKWREQRSPQGIAMQTVLACDETGFTGACSRNFCFREPFPEKVTSKLI